MKKVWIWHTEPFPCFTKTWRIMRLSVFFLCVMAAQTWALDSYSQVTRLSLNLKDTRVIDILGEIEEKTEFFFLFNQKLLDVERKVDIEVRNRKIDDILNELFAGTNVNYLVMNRQIVLTTAQPGSEEYQQQTAAQQQRQITGKVTDRAGAPLPGVTVVIKGTTTGTITNADGNYSISNIPEDATLVFSFVGLKSQEIPVEGRSSFSIVMEEDVLGIEEVVAIGYGTTRKRDLTGSVGSVDAEMLTARGTSGVLASMQGSIAGVNITQLSSRPGAEYNIQVRGLNTFASGGSPPLYVVDGIVTNDINFLNPQDIVKVDILKDASSTAIYGSRGSNGVVMVTTKTGQSMGLKEKTVVSYNGSYGVKTPARLPQQYTSRDWFDYRSHAYLQYDKGKGDNGMADWKIVPSGVYMQNPEAARRAYMNEDTDWLGALTQNGTQQNHYLNIAGNSGKMDFNVGIGYQNEDGIYIKENLQRYNLKLSLTYKISDKLMFGATSNLSQTEIEAGDADAYTFTFRMAPVFKIYDDNGDLMIQPGLVSNMGGVGANFTGNRNPIWEIETGTDNRRRHDVLASFYLQYSPIAGLDIRTNIQPRF
jgi:TonB-dependent starch-binding outer membrane protein SusC